MKPLDIIGNGMELLREQDFSSRLTPVGQKEADRIVLVFNRMMEQLKDERLRLREQNHFLDLLVSASPMGVVILTLGRTYFHAECGSKDYNALSVVTQYRCSVKQVVKVPRNVFMPRPNVDSTVLQFRFRERPQLDEAAFSAMVRACFAQRRKTILNNFASICGGKDSAAALLQKAGIDPGVRSEQLELSAFLNLFEVYEHENRSECEDQSVA